MLPKQTPTFDFTAEGKGYTIDVADFTGSEARAFRRAVGVSMIVALNEVERGTVDPLELVAGFKWLMDKRDQPDLEFEKVLDSITYDNIDLVGEVKAEEDPPTPGGDSSEASPPSLISTASSPGS